jgi:hypothetical protein
MLFALAAGSVTACAQAHREGLSSRPDSGIQVMDSSGGGNQDTGGGGNMDAPPHNDSPMGGMTQTLSQSMSNTDDGSGIACGNQTAIPPYTTKNSYIRVFTLSDYGISGVFHVSGVDFVASGVANSPPITVSVGTYNGTVSTSKLSGTITLAQGANLNPATGTNSIHVPLTADISGNLVVEVDQTTDGNTTNGYEFFPGANTAGETKTGYIVAPGCKDAQNNAITVPTNISTLAGSAVNLIMTVTGST